VIRTDTEALTKKKLEYNAKNLNNFDAVLFYTGGNLEMDDQQKADGRSDDARPNRARAPAVRGSGLPCGPWPMTASS
jgi:hypothetical protein